MSSSILNKRGDYLVEKISIEKVKEIAEEYDLKPAKTKGSNVVNIRVKPNENLEDISWEEFEKILQEKGLAVYKAEDSDFLKIMKK